MTITGKRIDDTKALLEELELEFTEIEKVVPPLRAELATAREEAAALAHEVLNEGKIALQADFDAANALVKSIQARLGGYAARKTALEALITANQDALERYIQSAGGRQTKRLDTKLDELEQAFLALLVEMTDRLLEMKEVASARRDIVLEMSSEDVLDANPYLPNSWRIVRNSLSPKVVMALERVGGLNLGMVPTRNAREWWQSVQEDE